MQNVYYQFFLYEWWWFLQYLAAFFVEKIKNDVSTGFYQWNHLLILKIYLLQRRKAGWKIFKIRKCCKKQII